MVSLKIDIHKLNIRLYKKEQFVQFSKLKKKNNLLKV